MIHSTHRNKSTYEDPKTSTILGTLLHLPAHLFWEIIRTACYEGKLLPQFAGEIIDYAFWPHWDSNGSRNTNFIEPDLFISFQEFDVIFEAKYTDDTGQNKIQWEQEITGYYNTIDHDKNIYLIALGGCKRMNAETLTVGANSVPILKCNWHSILVESTRMLEELGNQKYPDYTKSAAQRILKDTILGFNVHGMYHLKWLNDIYKENLHICIASSETIQNHFII